MYIIVNKIEFINSEVKYTPIGYVTLKSDANTINTNYANGLGSWINSNLIELTNNTNSIEEYFILNPISYSANQETTNIDGMVLSLIEDINNLV